MLTKGLFLFKNIKSFIVSLTIVTEANKNYDMDDFCLSKIIEINPLESQIPFRNTIHIAETTYNDKIREKVSFLFLFFTRLCSYAFYITVRSTLLVRAFSPFTGSTAYHMRLNVLYWSFSLSLGTLDFADG